MKSHTLLVSLHEVMHCVTHLVRSLARSIQLVQRCTGYCITHDNPYHTTLVTPYCLVVTVSYCPTCLILFLSVIFFYSCIPCLLVVYKPLFHPLAVLISDSFSTSTSAFTLHMLSIYPLSFSQFMLHTLLSFTRYSTIY